MRKTNSGFIALFSVIIISFVLLIVAVTLNFTGFSGRFNILDSESKERSNALAEACIDSGRLAIALDEYEEDEVVTVNDIGEDEESCEYIILADEVTAHACVNRAETFFRVEVDLSESNIPIQTFIELTEYSELSTCP